MNSNYWDMDYWNTPDVDSSDWVENPNWVENQQEVELAFDSIIHTTDRAYYLQFDTKEVWVPKSISYISKSKPTNLPKGKRAKFNLPVMKRIVLVPKWFVIKNELEDYIEE